MQYLFGIFYFGLMINWGMGQAVESLPPPKALKSPPTAIVVEKGLSYIVLKKGSKPTTKQYIKTLIDGWSSFNGSTQYNSQEKGPEIEDPDNIATVSAGLSKAIKNTPLGEKRRWWVALELMLPGYVDMVHSDYVIDIEVIDELDPLPPPSNLNQPPADAVVEKTGLKYQILHQGPLHDTGPHPSRYDTVKVHYSGWTMDGKMFDSSVLKGKPLSFDLGRVIKGWRVGVQRMTVGDKYRFWIPYLMAYGKRPRPGVPGGDLVFDIELFEIQPGVRSTQPSSAPYGE